MDELMRKAGFIRSEVLALSDAEMRAFCDGVYDMHPYVNMNYHNSLDDMSTLAHKYGHAMHHYLSARNQSYSKFRYVPFLAEIVSTANEVLLQDHLLATAKDDRVCADLPPDAVRRVRACAALLRQGGQADDGQAPGVA